MMQNRSPNMRAYSKDGEGKLFIYDEIGPDYLGMIGLKGVQKELDKLGDVQDLRVHLNTVGGDIVEGTGIYNVFKKHPARVNVSVDGAAYSIGSLIAMAGDTIEMAENALMMIHNPWCIAVGDADELRKRAEALDLMREAAVGVYASRTKNPRSKVSAWLDAETWFSADEAIANGFADSKAPNKAMAAKFDPKAKGFRNVPLAACARLHTLDRLEIRGADVGDRSSREIVREMGRAMRAGAMPADLGSLVKQLLR
jgi:ATP-dependent Clp protease protease subunit